MMTSVYKKLHFAMSTHDVLIPRALTRALVVVVLLEMDSLAGVRLKCYYH